jgi:hypothetical protein
MGAGPTRVSAIPAQNNPNDPIGVPIQFKNACGVAPIPLISDPRNNMRSLLPSNGEYDFDHFGPLGSCMIAGNYAPDSSTSTAGCYADPNGGCVIQGVQGYYSRTAYNGDPGRCCTNDGNQLDGELTCDPKYRDGPNATACNAYFSNYCNGRNIGLDSNCIAYSTAFPNLSYTDTLTFCQNNPTTQFCQNWSNKIISGQNPKQDWQNALNNWCTPERIADPSSGCMALCHSNPGFCAQSQTYCNKPGADKDYCSCLNYTSAVSGMANPPPAQCFSTCVQKGYSNSNAPCPPGLTICVQDLVLSAGQNISNFGTINAIQNCGNSGQTSGGQSTIQSTPGGGTSNIPGVNTSSNVPISQSLQNAQNQSALQTAQQLTAITDAVAMQLQKDLAYQQEQLKAQQDEANRKLRAEQLKAQQLLDEQQAKNMENLKQTVANQQLQDQQAYMDALSKLQAQQQIELANKQVQAQQQLAEQQAQDEQILKDAILAQHERDLKDQQQAILAQNTQANITQTQQTASKIYNDPDLRQKAINEQIQQDKKANTKQIIILLFVLFVILAICLAFVSFSPSSVELFNMLSDDNLNTIIE